MLTAFNKPVYHVTADVARSSRDQDSHTMHPIAGHARHEQVNCAGYQNSVSYSEFSAGDPNRNVASGIRDKFLP